MSDQSNQDAVEREREMREHEQEAARREGEDPDAPANPAGGAGDDLSDDADQPTPHGGQTSLGGQS